MRALVFDGALRYRTDWPDPSAGLDRLGYQRPGWAIVRVSLAGICRTDIEITRGYMGYRGVLGHEFVGVVDSSDDPTWIGERVVGEINAGCGSCEWCLRSEGRHCPTRLVLGIVGLDGCCAERCSLPVRNLHRVPDALTDMEAVFTEPLAAACEVLDQIPVSADWRCVVLGDGKLGILCAWVLASVARRVVLVGHHPEKLAAAEWGGVGVAKSAEGLLGADLVVEATGSPRGLTDAIRVVRPRGTICLKSTIAATQDLDLAPLVVNEVTVVGSRCGDFRRGLRFLTDFRPPVDRLVSSVLPLADGVAAVDNAAAPGALKVLLRV